MMNNKINFTQIFKRKDDFVVLFPKNLNDAFELFKSVLSIERNFKNVFFFFENDLKEVFSGLCNNPKINIYSYNKINIIPKNSLILNFSEKKLKEKSSIILSSLSDSNLFFPGNMKEKIHKLIGLLNLESYETVFEFDLTRNSLISTKFQKNNRKNLFIHFEKIKNKIFIKKDIEKIIEKANYNIIVEKNNFVNDSPKIEKLPKLSLYEIVTTALQADIFISDNDELYDFLKNFKKTENLHNRDFINNLS